MRRENKSEQCTPHNSNFAEFACLTGCPASLQKCSRRLSHWLTALPRLLLLQFFLLPVTGLTFIRYTTDCKLEGPNDRDFSAKLAPSSASVGCCCTALLMLLPSSHLKQPSWPLEATLKLPGEY